MGSQRVGHDWETELNWIEWIKSGGAALRVEDTHRNEQGECPDWNQREKRCGQGHVCEEELVFWRWKEEADPVNKRQRTQESILRKQGAGARELLQLHGCFHAELKPHRTRREKRLLSLLIGGKDRGQTPGGYLVRGWGGWKNRKGKKLINNPKCRGQMQ